MNHMNVRNLSGLSTGYFDSLDVAGNIIQYSGTFKSTSDISGLTIVGIPASYIMGLRSNIQQQLDSLQHVSISASYTTNYITQDLTISGAIYNIQNASINQQNDIFSLSGRFASNSVYLTIVQNQIFSLSGLILKNYNFQQNQILSLSGIIYNNYNFQQNQILSLSGIIYNNYNFQQNEIYSLSGLIRSLVNSYNIQQNEILSLSGIYYNYITNNYNANALDYETVSGMIDYRISYINRLIDGLIYVSDNTFHYNQEKFRDLENATNTLSGYLNFYDIRNVYNCLNTLSGLVNTLYSSVSTLASISANIYRIYNNPTNVIERTNNDGMSAVSVTAVTASIASVGLGATALAIAMIADGNAVTAQIAATTATSQARAVAIQINEITNRIQYIAVPSETTVYFNQGQLCTRTFWVTQPNTLFATRSDRLGTQGLIPIGPTHTFNDNGYYLNSGGITILPLVVNTNLHGIEPFKVDTLGNLKITGKFSSGFPNTSSQYPFNVDNDGSMTVGTPVILNNSTYYPFNVGGDGTMKVGTPIIGNYGVKYPFYIFPNGDIFCNSIYGNLIHQTTTTENKAVLCRGVNVSTISATIVETGYYFNSLSSGKLQLGFVTNPNIGVVDVSILCGAASTGNSVENSGIMSIRSSVWMHSGLQSFLAYRANPLNISNTSYIQALNTNTGDNLNQVSLNFKASLLNPTDGDASIVVTAGNYAIGALNTGSMFINAGSQLILGPLCPDIQIGARVNFLYSNGIYPSNMITLGNEFTTVNIKGQLVLSNSNANGIVMQNVNGHLRQF